MQRIGSTQHHLQNHAALGQRVARDKINQRPELRPNRVQIKLGRHIA
jgi:hypothetical protein